MKSLSEGISPQRSIRVPDSEWNLLKAVCAYEGVTVSEAVRDAIRGLTAEYADFHFSPASYTDGFEETWSYACAVCDAPEACGSFESAVVAQGEFHGCCAFCNDKLYND